MTTARRQHFAIVLDRSGSMSQVKRATERGLHAFLTEQRVAAPSATMSLYQFDDDIETVYENESLFARSYFELRPRGATALWDAIGFTVTRVRRHIASLDKADRPEQVVVTILTDGHENASTKFTLEEIKELIAKRSRPTNAQGKPKRTTWRFVFLGASSDTLQVATDLGIDPATTLHYDTDRTEESLTAASRMVTRGTRTGSFGFTDHERTITRH
ncbi:hypothetical protein ACFV1N_46910 [Streptosporangium canum]|uniref:vWA domain-containing protein n=1 Tax=Streptosporangium canum TaxID=324952 RepID=UPI0036AB5CD5